MKTFNSPILAIIALSLFIWLAYASYKRDRNDAVAYPESSIRKLNEMSRRATLKPLSRRQADAYRSIYNISDADLISAANIFGEVK